MSIIVNDHTNEAIKALNDQTYDALDEIGAVAASHADENVVAAGRVASGDLHQRIEHRVARSEKAVYIGTNLNYAVYHELGTGKFAEGGKGRKGWWVYVPGSEKKGKNSGKTYTKEQARQIVAILKSKGIDARMTEGIKPIHFLKRAATEHQEEYKRIYEKHLKR